MTNPQSAVYASSLPETVCGKDERVRIDPETSPPYSYICSLRITDRNGIVWVGSGFKIHIPNLTHTIVVTSGHCVYMSGAYATEIKVTFPGQATVTVNQAANMYASPEFINNGNADYDYGMISLHGISDEGFGFSGIIAEEDLTGRLVTNCGYPGDKHPWPQMWTTGGEITQVTDHRLYYMNDTMGGQSGSPVYTWYKGYWTVVGVHSYGGCPNSAPRFSSQMIYRFLGHIQNLKKYALRSVQFPDAYIRCDGTGVTKYIGPGGGTINCQYKPPSDWETFYIYPVEVTPSLARIRTFIVVLQNVKWTNTFVRMNGANITKYTGLGGGEVNCQWSGVPASSWESFIAKQVQQQYYFQSAQFPHRYIRVNATDVTKYVGSGGGQVNCQYYDHDSDVTSWEKFTLEERQ